MLGSPIPRLGTITLPGSGWCGAGTPGPGRGGGGGKPVGEGRSTRLAILPPHSPAPALLGLAAAAAESEASRGGFGAQNDLLGHSRGRLKPQTAPGMGDRAGQPEPRSSWHTPGAAAADAGAAAAVNGLLHNGFHAPDVQPPRLPLLQEPQPQPTPPQHDSPAKKCRLRRRMDSGRKNRPRKSCPEAGIAGAQHGLQGADRREGLRTSSATEQTDIGDPGWLAFFLLFAGVIGAWHRCLNPLASHTYYGSNALDALGSWLCKKWKAKRAPWGGRRWSPLGLAGWGKNAPLAAFGI